MQAMQACGDVSSYFKHVSMKAFLAIGLFDQLHEQIFTFIHIAVGSKRHIEGLFHLLRVKASVPKTIDHGLNARLCNPEVIWLVNGP